MSNASLANIRLVAPTSAAARRVRRALSLDFALTPGAHVVRDRPAGYVIDFRVKAPDPAWPPEWFGDGRSILYVAVAQFGLGCFEHYLGTRQERWLAGARNAAGHLLRTQVADGSARDGGWLHPQPRHTYPLPSPWMSAMAQGEAASLLVRLHVETGDERYAAAAQRALAPMRIPTEDGGLIGHLDGVPIPEEYPTSPPSFVLNGALFALWGFLDVATALRDADARRDFDTGAAALAARLPRWDTGRWSRYDLFPHRLPNVASFAYHRLHIMQLRIMEGLAPGHPAFAETRARFERYAASPSRRAEAFARKVAFRLAVPRRRLLEHAPEA